MKDSERGDTISIVLYGQEYLIKKTILLYLRFFPEDGHKYQKNNNALAGTVVDHGEPTLISKVHNVPTPRHQPSN